MTTALSQLAQEIKLDDTELNMVRAMLASTRIAILGQETMVPMQNLADQIQVEPWERDEKGFDVTLRNGVYVFVKMLFDQPRQLSNAAGTATMSFKVLDSLTWVDDSKFLRFQFNRMFLETLRSLAESRQLELF